ncbi:hypothetical protein FHT15_003848 [Xanthomonas campestris]
MSERRIQHRSYRAHRPSRQVLACSPSRDLTRHGCRVRAYRDVLAACPAMVGRQGPCTNAQRRGRGALTACGTRREPVPGGSVAASMPPHGPATGEDTAPDSWSAAFLKAWRLACGGQAFVDCVLEAGLPFDLRWENCERLSERPAIRPEHVMHCLQPHTPTISMGPCPLTVAGPYAAWMPRKSLHGWIHGVSRDGGRARALQPTRSVDGAAPSPLAGHAVTSHVSIAPSHHLTHRSAILCPCSSPSAV